MQSSPLSPGLYIVSTPIGNLRDITLRALDVLRQADLVLAEDTRQSRKLLQAYNIDAQLSPYHDHNASKQIPKIIDKLKAGLCLALVSDAGTPMISDPGYKLVSAAIKAGIEVFPVPGASSILAGLVKSGLPSDRFFFEGFLPAKSAARKSVLADIKRIPGTLIVFETGPRIRESLQEMLSILGERDVVLTRELTKHYEEARHGSFAEIIESVIKTPPRGELVVLIGPAGSMEQWPEALVLEGLKNLIPQAGVKQASAEISEQSGWNKRDLYKMALALKDDKDG